LINFVSAHEVSLGMPFPIARHRIRLQEIVRREAEASGRISKTGSSDPASGSD